MTSEQIRAARGLLRWSAKELGRRAGVHISTIQRLERNRTNGHFLTIRNIQQAFEDAGIIFLEDEDGLEVRMRKSVAPEAKVNKSVPWKITT